MLKINHRANPCINAVILYTRNMASGRRKAGQENVRSLVRTSGGKSYAITLPREVIRAFGWERRQKLELTVDEKRKRITISDWPRK